MADSRPSSVIREVLVGDNVGKNVIAAVSQGYREALAGLRVGLAARGAPLAVIREVLALERPNTGAAQVLRETIGYTEPARDVKAATASVIREALVKQPKIVLPAIIREALIEGVENPLVEIAAQISQISANALPVQPASEVQSITRSNAVQSKVALQFLDNAFPWSFTRVTSQTQLAVQAFVQGLPISIESVGAVSSYAVQQTLYVGPDGVLSTSAAAQSVMLVCMSTDIPYIPPTGALVPQVRQITVIARVEGLPISVERAAAIQQLTTVAKPEALPISVERVSTVQQLAALAYGPMPFPTSPGFAAQARTLAVLAKPADPNVIGTELATSVHSYAAQAVVMPVPFGIIQAKAETQLAVQASAYPLPGNMTKTQAAQTRLISATGLPVAPASEVWSTSRYNQALNKYTQAAQVGFYPDPDTMYFDASNRFVTQATSQAVQRYVLPLWNSYTPVPSVSQLATQRTIYPSPEDMFGEGLFVTSALEQVAQVAIYPPPGAPDGDLLVQLAMEQVVSVATYPPTDTEFSYQRSSGMTEQVATASAYDSKATVYSRLVVNGLYEQAAYTAAYADKDSVLSYSVSAQLVEQVALTVGYADKDDPQSFVQTPQMVEQMVVTAVYQDKDVTASLVRVSEFVEQVVLIDQSLYGLPVAPRRRAPVIVTRYVW